jgi:hypothetical protein
MFCVRGHNAAKTPNKIRYTHSTSDPLNSNFFQIDYMYDTYDGGGAGGRIVDNNPISGTQVLRTTPTEPPVPLSMSTSTVTRTGNSVAGTGISRTGTDVGDIGEADITLSMEDTRSPVRTTEVPIERDLQVQVTAEPQSVRGDLVPRHDLPRTAPAAHTVNQICTTLPGVTLGTQTSSHNALVMAHPGKGSCMHMTIPTDPRSGIYTPNGKHRGCTYTPRKQPHTDTRNSKDTQGVLEHPVNRHINQIPTGGG